MENDLKADEWEEMWLVFIYGDIETKRHLLFNNTFKDNFDLCKIFNTCCKIYPVRAWKARLETYNLNKL